MWGLGQRRTFLVDRRGQLRSATVAAVVVTAVLAVLLVSLHASRERATEALVAQVPTLADTLAAQNRVELMLQIAGAVVFLVMVVSVTVLETHKTAGAAFNLSRQMGRIRDGEYITRVTLRKGDNLQLLAHAFNEMSIELDERLWQDIELFDRLARQVQTISDSDEAGLLAEALNDEAARRRRMANFPEADQTATIDVGVHDHDPVAVG
jgi:methyl-accepting chemotaxis protein